VRDGGIESAPFAFVFYNGTIRSAGEFIWTIEKEHEETWEKLTLHMLVEIGDSPLRANRETRIVTKQA
jgi:hypothetical protein